MKKNAMQIRSLKKKEKKVKPNSLANYSKQRITIILCIDTPKHVLSQKC